MRTLDLEGGRVAGVVTEKGRVRCAQAVLAGGAWSTYFAANAGIDLPQLAVRSTVARTEPAPSAYVHNTNTPGLAIRRRGGRRLHGLQRRAGRALSRRRARSSIS